MCGGGLVATATMAEVGFFAEFMAWVKRMPVWSFPPKLPIRTFVGGAKFESVLGLEHLATIYYDRKAIENLKANMPIWAAMEPRKLPAETNNKSIQMLRYALNPAEID